MSAFWQTQPLVSLFLPLALSIVPWYREEICLFRTESGAYTGGDQSGCEFNQRPRLLLAEVIFGRGTSDTINLYVVLSQH